MAGYGLAALAGLGQGTRGLPQGMIQGEQLDLQKQQFDETVRHRKMQEAQQSTDMGQLVRLGLIPSSPTGSPPGERIPNHLAALMATNALGRQKDEREAQERGQQADIVARSAKGAPATLMGVLQPGEDPEAAAMIPRTPGTAPDPRRAAISELLRTKGGGDLAKILYPDHDKFIASDKPVLDTAKGTWITPPAEAAGATPPFVPPPGARAVPTVSDGGRKVSTRYEPPSEGHDRAAGALADKGWRPEMPGYAQALYMLTTAPTPVSEGGFTVPRTMSIPDPPGGMSPVQAPATPPAGAGPQGPQRMPGGGIQGPPKTQAMPGEQVPKLADTRSMIQKLGMVEKLYREEFTGPIRGRLGGLRQTTGVMATPEETAFRSIVQDLTNELLYLRSGAAVTEGEYQRILKVLPTPNDPASVFPTKLSTARTLLEMTLKNREAEFAARGFRGGGEPDPMQPRPVPMPSPTPTPGQGTRVRDPRTGRTGTLAPGAPVPPGLEVIR